MPVTDWTLFLFALALGSYVQAVAGFALGLVLMGFAAVFGLSSVATTAVVISILGFFNSGYSLKGHLSEVRWRWVGAYYVGILPGLIVGFALLETMSQQADELLRGILGAFLLAGALLLTLRPRPQQTPSTSISRCLVGTVGGILNGLFATGGPPIAFHMYRQPVRVAEIRASLLAIFVTATLSRVIYATTQGSIGREELTLAAAGLPVVIVCTYAGRRWRPPVSDIQMRRLAFALVAMLGCLLLI